MPITKDTSRRERLRRQRAALRRQLRQVEQEIASLPAGRPRAATRPRLAFYAEVVLVSGPAKGERGAILGRSPDRAKGWLYTVYLYRTGACVCAGAGALKPTGVVHDRSTFYDGSAQRVRVDKAGRGQPAGAT